MPKSLYWHKIQQTTHTPWQNKAKREIGDLATMVKRCIWEFGVPISRHPYCQKWSVDIQNHLVSGKLEWRTPKEKLTRETPDISIFCFHFWNSLSIVILPKNNHTRDGEKYNFSVLHGTVVTVWHKKWTFFAHSSG